MNKKLEIKEKLHTFDTDTFNGDMKDIGKIFDFKKYQKDVISKKYPYTIPAEYPTQAKAPLPDLSKYHKFIMSHEKEYDYDYDNSYSIFVVYGIRYESDDEFNKRIETNKKKSISAERAAKVREEAKKKRELTLYNNLKAKYGKEG